MSSDIKRYKKYKKEFLSNVEKTDTCWLWKSTKDKNGYGRFYIDKQTYYAHRMSYLIFNGNIPEGKVIRHICDNPTCVNPKHLLVGTQEDNLNDAVKRDRRVHLQKLTLNTATIIKTTLKHSPEDGISKKLAKLYNVSPAIISRIKTEKTWDFIEVKNYDDNDQFSFIGPIKYKNSYYKHSKLDPFDRIIALSKTGQQIFQQIRDARDKDLNLATIDWWKDLNSSQARFKQRGIIDLTNNKLVCKAKEFKKYSFYPEQHTYMINPFFIKCNKYYMAKEFWKEFTGETELT